MAKVLIPWETGSGNIEVDLTGVGNSSPTVKSSAPNDGLDRSQAVTWRTTAGSPQKTVSMTVSQPGLYEVLEDSDGALTDSNDSPLWVLKQ